MKVRYFVIDTDGKVRKAPQTAVHRLWEGKQDATALGWPGASELRLISVICDDKLLPASGYLLRLPLTDGWCRFEQRLKLQIDSMLDSHIPHEEVIRHHITGWPENWLPQLAQALDVPVAKLDGQVGVGGPLLMAAAMQVSVQQAITYFE